MSKAKQGIESFLREWEAGHRHILILHGGRSVGKRFVACCVADAVGNPAESRAIAGKLLVELARAQQSPEKIVISLLNNQKLRWTASPIYNTITIVSITDEVRAAGNRSEICARLATVALAHICSTTLQFSSEQFADCQAQTDQGRYGLPLWRRLGFGRCFVSQRRNRAIIREAMLAEASRIL